MLSVCIPVYNTNVLPLANSLNSQAMKVGFPTEIILLDDASDESFIPTEVLSLSLVTVHRNKTNLGRSKTRNLLAQFANGTHLLFLDGDSQIISDNFLRSWWNAIQQEDQSVFYGGSVYQDVEPDAQSYLRWKTSITRESLSLEKRSAATTGFKTNNFVVKKSLVDAVKFDEELKGYGHEDTLFGFELQQLGFRTHQIDNPVLNATLDDNDAFLRKTENAVRNLVHILIREKQNKDFIKHVKLLRYYLLLRKWQVSASLIPLRKLFLGPLKKRLSSGKKSGILFFFDSYKLLVLDREFRKLR
jgi:glycosyltransferase involved in cell wall biosynthesis